MSATPDYTQPSCHPGKDSARTSYDSNFFRSPGSRPRDKHAICRVPYSVRPVRLVSETTTACKTRSCSRISDCCSRPRCDPGGRFCYSADDSLRNLGERSRHFGSLLTEGIARDVWESVRPEGSRSFHETLYCWSLTYRCLDKNKTISPQAKTLYS